jgi:salicylate 5-hydroxylase large subunit
MGATVTRRWPSEGSSRVPYWVYSDPEVYQREQERIFRGPSWSYVGLAAEVPEPGDFRRTHVGETPVVVVRDRRGRVNVVVNRCAHRGVQFCREPSGNATKFECPYHQWTYNLEGRLLGVPFRKGLDGQGGMPDDFTPGDHSLTTLAVAERNGVLFASFDPGAPPLEEYLGLTMLGWFDRVFDGRPLRLLGYSRQRLPCNWKLMFENIKDPYHASLLHVFLVTFGLFRADQPSAVQMDDTGRHSVLVSSKGEQQATAATAEMKSFRADFQLHDPTLLTPVREFPGSATVVMQTLWPNLIVQQQSNTLATRQMVPRGPEAHDLIWTFFGYEDDTEEMTRIRLRQANLMGPAGYVSIDDGEVMRMSQDGVRLRPDGTGLLEMGGRGTGDEDHMVTEAAIRAFYDHYRTVMELA